MSMVIRFPRRDQDRILLATLPILLFPRYLVTLKSDR
jgi:hypothetical protein